MKLVFQSSPSYEFDLAESDKALTPSPADDGSRADYIEALAVELLSMLVKHPDEVRPGAVQLISHVFRESAEIGIGLAVPYYLFEPFCGWNSEAAAHVISSFPFSAGDQPNKRLAVELSDALSYEEGQELYRFVTLVTRLIPAKG